MYAIPEFHSSHSGQLNVLPTTEFMKTIRLLAFASILFTSCSIFSQTRIPESWQPGMTLTSSYGGGMRYYSYKLQISDTGSFFIENVEGKVTNYILELTSKDLDSLLAFLRKHRLDKIKTEIRGPMHDKGTEHISLTWNGHTAGAGESYMELIADKDKEDYNAIDGYLYVLRESKKKKVNHIPGQKSAM